MSIKYGAAKLLPISPSSDWFRIFTGESFPKSIQWLRHFLKSKYCGVFLSLQDQLLSTTLLYYSLTLTDRLIFLKVFQWKYCNEIIYVLPNIKSSTFMLYGFLMVSDLHIKLKCNHSRIMAWETQVLFKKNKNSIYKGPDVQCHLI